MAGHRPEHAGEMTSEDHVDGDVVAGDDHLFNLDAEVRHRLAEIGGGEGRSPRPLRPARRQGVVDEGRTDRGVQRPLIAGVPEIVEGGRRLYRRGLLRLRQGRADHEVVDLHAGREGRRG